MFFQEASFSLSVLCEEEEVSRVHGPEVTLQSVKETFIVCCKCPREEKLFYNLLDIMYIIL